MGIYTYQALGSVAICDVVEKGENLLDCCSAPGGKSIRLSHKFDKVHSWDIHEHRSKLIKDAATKLGITNITNRVADASEYHTQLYEKYDRVLLDVPCSGIGVIRKKPDIKWTRKPEDLEELLNTQKLILECCSAYVKTGGILVYSTCTVLKEENEKQIENFLAKHKEFKLLEEIKLFPNVNGTDGFYIAKVEKI